MYLYIGKSIQCWFKTIYFVLRRLVCSQIDCLSLSAHWEKFTSAGGACIRYCQLQAYKTRTNKYEAK